MGAGRKRERNGRDGDDDFDDTDGTITRLRMESHTVSIRPLAGPRATRPARRDPFGRTPTVEYPKELLELLCVLSVVAS
jgi:hypothetical protein